MTSFFQSPVGTLVSIAMVLLFVAGVLYAVSSVAFLDRVDEWRDHPE
jgi:hypothetical protein